MCGDEVSGLSCGDTSSIHFNTPLTRLRFIDLLTRSRFCHANVDHELFPTQEGISWSCYLLRYASMNSSTVMPVWRIALRRVPIARSL